MLISRKRYFFPFNAQWEIHTAAVVLFAYKFPEIFEKKNHYSWIYVFLFLGKLTHSIAPDSIWWILWFHFFMPSPPPQCVQRFHCYYYNEKNIIASLLKFAGYIHNHKILPGNIFGLILKSRMAASKDFCCTSSLEQRIL